jgi:hypothetical protein
MVPNQPRQRAGFHRHDRHFQIKRACVWRRRKSPRDSGHMKTLRAQIVGNEPSDQAGRAKHEDFTRVLSVHSDLF